MPFAAAVLLLAIQQPSELADETRFDSVGIAVKLPKGWNPVKVEAPSLVKVQAPAGGLAGGDFLLQRLESDEPTTTAIFAAGMADWHQKTYPGIEILSQDDLDIGGKPARRLQMHWKDLSVSKICVARSPIVLVSLDFTCQVAQESAGKVLAKQILDSVRFYAPVVAVDSKDADARARGVQRDARLPERLFGDSHFVVLVADKSVGRWKTTLRAAKVEGKDGYELNSLITLPDGNGTRTDVVKGAFLLDGSFQRMEIERTSERKDRAKKVFTAVASINQGRLTATRVIDGQNAPDASFDVPPGTYLNDFGDIARSSLVLAGKNFYALRRIDPFNDFPALEMLEVAAAEPIKVGGAERPMVVVLAKVDDRRHLVYRFEEDGRWESARMPGVKVEIRRCSAEDYEKAK